MAMPVSKGATFSDVSNEDSLFTLAVLGDIMSPVVDKRNCSLCPKITRPVDCGTTYLNVCGFVEVQSMSTGSSSDTVKAVLFQKLKKSSALLSITESPDKNPSLFL